MDVEDIVDVGSGFPESFLVFPLSPTRCSNIHGRISGLRRMGIDGQLRVVGPSKMDDGLSLADFCDRRKGGGRHEIGAINYLLKPIIAL